MSATGCSTGSAGVRSLSRWFVVACVGLSLVVAATIAGPARANNVPLAWTMPVRADNQAPFTQPWLTRRLSCPSVSLCVGVGPTNEIVVTTDPGSTQAAWTHTIVSGAYNSFADVSCPSVSLCVATGAADSPNGVEPAVGVSTDPTGGPRAWSITLIDDEPGDSLTEISCPTVSFCAALDSVGDVVTSTDPTGPTSAWHVAKLPSNRLWGLSCPTSSFCVAADYQGNVFTSTDPDGERERGRRPTTV